MRAPAAIVALALCSCSSLHALAPPPPPAPRDRLSRALISALGISEGSPANRLIDCGRSLGLTKCLSALSVWRAEKALVVLESGNEAQFNLREDVESFPYQTYANVSEDQIYSQLAEDTDRLLSYRSLSLTVPGYSLELESRGNGTLNVDILKNNDAGSKRSMSKKMLKEFYNVMPMLLLPGLIMSAILPFVLPALKMTTVAVGMLNNMALSGAVFTLLRNNAFNDHYEKKVIYVNEGYKNEKFSPLYFSKDFHKGYHKEINLDHFDEYAGSASNVEPVIQNVKPDLMQNLEQPMMGGFPENMNVVQDAMNTDWINQYYGNAEFGDTGNIASVSNIGSISSISNLNAVSPSSLITVTGSSQPETKVRRSSKIKYNPFRS